MNLIGIGYDCRLSSPGYAQALAEGMAEEGLDVVINEIVVVVVVGEEDFPNKGPAPGQTEDFRRQGLEGGAQDLVTMGGLGVAGAGVVAFVGGIVVHADAV
jgi:hypothetical protein